MSEEYEVKRPKRTPASTLVQAVGTMIVIVAIIQELRKKPADRTWHGRVARFVPYDFRMPTFQRFRDTYWAPENPKLLSSTLFGAGWAVNFATVWKICKRVCGSCCGAKQGEEPEVSGLA